VKIKFIALEKLFTRGHETFYIEEGKHFGESWAAITIHGSCSYNMTKFYLNGEFVGRGHIEYMSVPEPLNWAQKTVIDSCDVEEFTYGDAGITLRVKV